jgi:hypothetical protein
MLGSRDAEDRVLGAFLLLDRQLSEKEIGRLRALLGDGDTEVRNFAVQTLAASGDVGSLQRCLEVLASGPPRDLTGAAWGLAEMARRRPEVHEEVVGALRAYKRRARGASRGHAQALLDQLLSEAGQ